MSKKRRQSTSRQQQVASYANPQQRPQPFIRWGVIALGGGLILLALQMIFVILTLTQGHNHTSFSQLFPALIGPLLIDGTMIVIGLLALCYGLWQKKR